MDCKEFKIWLLTAGESKFDDLPVFISEHIESCPKCLKGLELIKSSITIFKKQKESVLPDSTAGLIVRKLQALDHNKEIIHFGSQKSFVFRLAISAIVAVGLILGVIAGSILSQNSSTNKANLWDNEFVVITDNSAESINVFE